MALGAASSGFCIPPAAAAVEAARAYAKSRNLGVLSGGCSCSAIRRFVRKDGKVIEKCYVPCSAEEQRGRVEAKLHALELYPPGKRLSMAVYLMARNIASEGGSGTGAEKLALGEALINRAKATGKTFAQIALYEGRYFAEQYGLTPAVATKANPRWDDLVAAEYVLAGLSYNFARGATHYFGPAAMDAGFRKGRYSKDARRTLDLWYERDSLNWVGYVPGIDIRRQIFFRKGPRDPKRLAAARAAIASHSPDSVMHAIACDAQRPALSVALPLFLGASVLAGAGFLWWARKRAIG